MGIGRSSEYRGNGLFPDGERPRHKGAVHDTVQHAGHSQPTFDSRYPYEAVQRDESGGLIPVSSLKETGLRG